MCLERDIEQNLHEQKSIKHSVRELRCSTLEESDGGDVDTKYTYTHIRGTTELANDK